MTAFRNIFFTVAILTMAQPLFAQHEKHGLTWYTDVMKANAAAKKANKPLFAFFTGSDWCGWCHRLEKAVFLKPGFQAWAKKNVILVELDFPRQKQLPDSLVQQNNSLQNFFQVQGFPTIWIFDVDRDSSNNKYNISAWGSLGYPSAEAGKEEATFLENANAILAKRTKK